MHEHDDASGVCCAHTGSFAFLGAMKWTWSSAIDSFVLVKSPSTFTAVVGHVECYGGDAGAAYLKVSTTNVGRYSNKVWGTFDSSGLRTR